jgi:hypothetical protein
MKKSSALLLAGALVGFMVAAGLWAGGPLELGLLPGDVLRWVPSNQVEFRIDPGPLKVGTTTIDHATGAAIVRQAAEKWNQVSTSTLRMVDRGLLSADVNANNYETVFSQLLQGQPINPFIFDADGDITRDFLGSGSSTGILGFTMILGVDYQAGRFLSGWAVFNGTNVTTVSVNNGNFGQTVLHEMGHFLGLDHSQGLIENWTQRSVTAPGRSVPWAKEVPIMFPVGGIATLPRDPIADDIAWLSWMYPTTDFLASKGSIKGRVFRRSGGPFQGANVVASRAVDNGDGTYAASRENVVSVVSDFLFTGTGEFELPGLPPGDYFVHIDPISSQFTGGSGIGPFDSRSTGFPRDYYSEEESGEDNPGLKKLIRVEAGQVVEGIEIIANEPAVILSRAETTVLNQLDDDDELLCIFPEGFAFPFFGAAYDRVVVNSDGNLTFLEGDAGLGLPRTEERFLNGPPRIAPLFTDLDPNPNSGSGQVEVTAGNGFVRFRWNGVPEFWDPGQNPTPPGPNDFSVTLFSTGEIEVVFNQVAITPDPSGTYPQQGLHSIVGVTPGGGTPGSSQDLSPGLFEIRNAPIYQVFPGTTFDLTGETIRFQAATSELLFPFLSGNATEFTGFAISNYGENAAAVTAEARSSDGTLAELPVNPSGGHVPAGQQWAILGQELFQAGNVEGWVRILSSSPEVASFFQFGNGLQGKLTRMDGSAAFTSTSKSLYFTRLFHGDGVFPTLQGPRNAETWIAIANPYDEDDTLTLRLYGTNGGQIASRVIEIPAYGRVFGRLDELINPGGPVNQGFLQVTAAGEGVVGFQLIDFGDSIIGLNASFGNNGPVAYSAQLGHGLDIFTNLKLVNTTDQSRVMTLTAYLQEAGGTVSTRTLNNVVLGPKSSIQQDVGQLFGLLPGGGSQPLSGSIKVETQNGAGIVGDVVFGDPHRLRFSAALPLQTELIREAIHSQVSNGVDPTDPSLSSFTGLALFNPQTQAASVTIEVYDRDGLLVGDTELELTANARVSQVLYPDLVPESQGLVRGYIRIVSTRPVVVQQLFGNSTLDYLSAVVPKVIR